MLWLTPIITVDVQQKGIEKCQLHLLQHNRLPRPVPEVMHFHASSQTYKAVQIALKFKLRASKLLLFDTNHVTVFSCAQRVTILIAQCWSWLDRGITVTSRGRHCYSSQLRKAEDTEDTILIVRNKHKKS